MLRHSIIVEPCCIAMYILLYKLHVTKYGQHGSRGPKIQTCRHVYKTVSTHKNMSY